LRADRGQAAGHHPGDRRGRPPAAPTGQRRPPPRIPPGGAAAGVGADGPGGTPQVTTGEIGGRIQEPIERVSVDIPEDYLGVVTQLLSMRKGRMETMTNHGTGWCRMELLAPSRGVRRCPCT